MTSNDRAEQTGAGRRVVFRGWTFRTQLGEAGLDAESAPVLWALLAERWFTIAELRAIGGEQAEARVRELSDDTWGGFCVETSLCYDIPAKEWSPAGPADLLFRIRPQTIKTQQIAAFVHAHRMRTREGCIPKSESFG